MTSKGRATTLARGFALALAFALTIPANVAYADGPTTPPKKGGGPGGGVQPMADEYDPGGGLSSSVVIVICNGESRDPHFSGHVPGRVNAEGITYCTSNPNIYVTVQSKLYKEFAWFWFTQIGEAYSSGFGTASAFANAACQGSLNYRIVSTHTITAGNTETKQSANTKYVTC